MSSLPQLTDEEKQQWLKDKYQVATKFLADKGLVTVSVSDADSRYIIPLFSVWKLNLIDKSSVWVIAGDLPTDYIETSAAKDAREAVRHFSYKWQMQADQLLQTGAKEQQEFANILISRAENLYNIFIKDEIW
ncbi:DUF4826 family protein [Colwellia sp. 1_MG-2023]|uniref:DUF4826 family protein n=1 Tax=Colwellia sp. 1_MG-2023 TaxID=3062649 RepID=UPI0026E23B94|nr:DUF4826 family protein [Colwellia sp. 1_MG-2023]MDO6446896.1 DUF4826 family protein [Colwellia sp. 1_MG-2023]